MKMGVKMRIYPTKEQEELLFYYCRAAHDMQNFLVEKYQDGLPHTNSYGIVGYTPRDLMTDFGRNVPQRIAYGAMTQYVTAVNFAYKKVANRPKFHKFNPNKQSFYVKSMKFKIIKGCIMCPTKKGFKMASKNILVDKKYVEKFSIKEITEPRFSFLNGKWYLSGCYDVDEPQQKNVDNYIGLDWGVKKFITTSDGKCINYPESVLRQYQRIRRLQSIRDKKKKGSKNTDKINVRLRSAFERLENLKIDFIEKTTTDLCKNNNVVVENLSFTSYNSPSYIRRMYMIAPRVRFFNKLSWKCQRFGTEYIVVDPMYTSQACCVCGLLHDLTLRDRVMVCECGNVMDRDINAAINIRNAALAATGVCCT